MLKNQNNMGNSESDINYQKFEHFITNLSSYVQISRKEGSDKLIIDITLDRNKAYCKSDEKKILNYIEDHKEMKLYNVNILN